MSRKTVALTGSILASLMVLAGCGGGGGSSENDDAGKGTGAVPEPAEPVTITFQSWIGNSDEMKQLVKDFQKVHPNITVKLQATTAEGASQKLTTQVAGGNPPDVAFVNASDTSDFASRGAVINLDDYISRSDVVNPDDYVEAFKTFVTYEDSMYGLPIDGESTGLFYRTDLFEQAGIDGPPQTWDEFQAAAEALTDESAQQYGFTLFASESAYYWYPWLYQAGGDLLTEDGKDIAFDSPEAKEAADFYVNLANYSPPDYFNSNSYDGRVAFAEGQSAMYVAGAWFAGTMSTEFPKLDGKWDTAPLPSGPAGCKTTIAGDSLILLKGGDNPDAAWKWIEFLSEPDNLALLTYKSPGGTLLPPLASLLNSPDLIKEKPVLKGFAELMKCGVASTVSNPKFPRIEQALNEELGKAIYGEQSASEALDNAAAEGREILGN
jgi:ABC-type glycerol-3-phosphate transport system substrate-binding protein